MNAISAPLSGNGLDPREGFYQRVQGGWHPASSDAPSVPADESELARVPKDLHSLWREISAQDFYSEPVHPDAGLLAFHAPLGLTEGAWLQGLARPDNGHLPAVAKLFAVYLKLMGKDESASPSSAYRGLLARSGCLLPPVTSLQFARDPRLGAAALEFASLRLELGWRAAGLFPEVLGFTLAYAGSASPWRLAGMAREVRQSLLRELAVGAFQALEIHLVRLKGVRSEAQWRRVRTGFAFYRRHEHAYGLVLEARAVERPALREQVAAIFRSKAPVAKGYHGAAQLGGKVLDAWFAQQPFDAEGFLQAFAASPYAAGRAGERLFDRLTGFGGPMFGIFSTEESALIGTWLDDAVPEASRRQQAASSPAADEETLRPVCIQSPAISIPRTASPGRFGRDVRTRDTRVLFYRLLDSENCPDAEAEATVERILCRAERRIRGRGKLKERFFAYSAEALQERVALIHAQEAARYKPFRGRPRLQREEYLFGIRQFAPAILVDGCWLQRACSAAQQDQRLHRLLFRIYADELGAGNAQWNHPNVYRRLLEQAGIALPEVRDAAFAQDPGFLGAAFDLPAYLLGISLFPDRWLPEILGLNLAIELSGLGAQYRFLADELAFWGLDPLIVRLHQSIDSLAGGHAALAVEAVQIHQEEVRALGGEASVAAHWRRVWCGYLSLGAATQRFRWALGLAFARRFLPARGLGWLRSVLAQA